MKKNLGLILSFIMLAVAIMGCKSDSNGSGSDAVGNIVVSDVNITLGKSFTVSLRSKPSTDVSISLLGAGINDTYVFRPDDWETKGTWRPTKEGVVVISADSSDPDDVTVTDDPPKLLNLAISNSLFKVASKGGVFDPSHDQKPFSEFGADGYHLIYDLDVTTDIIPEFDGVVTHVDIQGGGDCEVIYQPFIGSPYWSTNDHLSCYRPDGVTPWVSVGQKVFAEKLDNDGNVTQRPTVLGRTILGQKFETDLLQQVDIVNNHTHRWCPVKYLDADIRTKVEGLVVQLMKDIESAASNTNLYDEAEMPYPGCKELYEYED